MENIETKLNKLTSIVYKENGSDLHLESGHHPIIRVVGSLISLVKEPELTAEEIAAMLTFMVGEDRYRAFLEEREIDFSHAAQKGVRFRGNAYFERETVSVALRLIPAEIKSLDELNLPRELEQFARMKQGFFLVVGPVGHGKSTTLAALVDLINKERAEHIITIEDPIEFLYKQEQSIIDQREVGLDTNSFSTALHSVFRQDVDVIMIGEMRGPNTMATAVTAAETGHLVLSTLHTNNAAQTINRIIDSFPSDQQNQIRNQLSLSLAGIFSQRLIPRVSGGLIPSYELLINNSAVSNLIREGRTHEINVVIETGTSEGMIDMNRTLVNLIRQGEITQESARAYSMNPRGLSKLAS